MTRASFDLHAHSWFSDGELSPSALVQRAAANGLQHLALTDHDTIAGLEEAYEAARSCSIHIIPGIEFSVTWNYATLHVLGLNIDAEQPVKSSVFRYILGANQDIRFERSQKIGLELEKAGFPRALEGAMRYAKFKDCITRTHFAQYLIEKGVASTTREVYRHYLLPGKPGYVESNWLSLPDIIRGIHEANGVAVLAHPGRYILSSTARRRLLDEFAAYGGDGIEVMTPSHSPDQVRYYADQCNRLGLKASVGSDFHSPKESRIDVGCISSPPRI